MISPLMNDFLPFMGTNQSLWIFHLSERITVLQSIIFIDEYANSIFVEMV